MISLKFHISAFIGNAVCKGEDVVSSLFHKLVPRHVVLRHTSNSQSKLNTVSQRQLFPRINSLLFLIGRHFTFSQTHIRSSTESG